MQFRESGIFVWSVRLYVYRSRLAPRRLLTLKKIQMIRAMMAKMIINSNQSGHLITVFSTMEVSPKMLTVCLALKIPTKGNLQVSV